MSGSGESVVTIGTYDGVHLGHQLLIAAVQAEADQRGLRSVVVTFDRHPSSTLRPANATKLITGLDLKLELIEAAGVAEVVVLQFDSVRAQQSPEEFATELATDLEARLILVGENFRFGRDHRGDVSLLERLGRDLGFAASGFDLVTDGAAQVVVSSRRIRDQIAAGAIAEVNRFLGRPYELRGRWSARAGGGVVTPSVDLSRPPAGIYRVIARVPGQTGAPATVEVRVFEDGSVSVPVPPAFATDGDIVGLLFTASE